MPEKLFGNGSEVPPWQRERARILPEDLAIYSEAASVLKFWYLMQGSDRDVIDFDLAGITLSKDSQMFIEANRKEPYKRQKTIVIEELEDLHNRVQVIDQTRMSAEQRHNLEFATEQIGASLLYARKLRGDAIDNIDYIENTQGAEAEETLPDVLNYQQDVVGKQLEANGIKDFTSEGFRQWKLERALTEDKAQQALRAESESGQKDRNRFLGYRYKPYFDIKPVNKNAYFWVWIDTDKQTGKFVMQQNFGTEDREKVWTYGKTEELGKHEGGQHQSRMARRAERIWRNELPQFFGVTTVHGPDQTVEEGTAQVLPLLVPGMYDKMSPEGKLQTQLTIYRSMVYGNAHLRINSGQFTKEGFKTYIKDKLPWETDEEIEEQIKERTENPMKQSYLWSYMVGAEIMLIASMIYSPRGVKRLLRTSDDLPHTPTQLTRLMYEIAKDSKNVMAKRPKWVYDAFDYKIRAHGPNPLHNIS